MKALSRLPDQPLFCKVDGRNYPVFVDKLGALRFKGNRVIQHLVETQTISLVTLSLDFHKGKFPVRDYAEFYMGMGYSLSGFCDLEDFKHLVVEHPLWKRKRP